MYVCESTVSVYQRCLRTGVLKAVFVWVWSPSYTLPVAAVPGPCGGGSQLITVWLAVKSTQPDAGQAGPTNRASSGRLSVHVCVCVCPCIHRYLDLKAEERKLTCEGAEMILQLYFLSEFRMLLQEFLTTVTNLYAMILHFLKQATVTDCFTTL